MARFYEQFPKMKISPWFTHPRCIWHSFRRIQSELC